MVGILFHILDWNLRK